MQARPSHTRQDLWGFHGTKQRALGLEWRILHLSPTSVILGETLGYFISLSVLPLLNGAVFPARPEDVLILELREGWNKGADRWIFSGSAYIKERELGSHGGIPLRSPFQGNYPEGRRE